MAIIILTIKAIRCIVDHTQRRPSCIRSSDQSILETTALYHSRKHTVPPRLHQCSLPSDYWEGLEQIDI